MMNRMCLTVNISSRFLLVFLAFLSLISSVRLHLNVSKLNCFDDYIRTMVCEFTSNKFNCSGYSLDFESTFQEHYACNLTFSEEVAQYFHSKCGCTVQLPEFVNAEKYTVRLMDGGTVLNSTFVTAIDNIKPNTPEILMVRPMKNGNFKVTWDTNYPKENALSEHLEIQLSYRKKGEPHKASKIANASKPFHEIPGRDLEPSSEYVVRARSFSRQYSTQFSDWSREVEWTSPASAGNVLKFIIPLLCVLLAINICAFYWCCARLKAKWWDKIPTPSNDVKDMVPGNFKVFIPKHYDSSSNHIHLLTIDETKEKPRPTTWMSECEKDVQYKNITNLTLAKDSGISSTNDCQKSLGNLACTSSSSESDYKNILYTRIQESISSPELPNSGTSDVPSQSTPGCVVVLTYSDVDVPIAPSPDQKKTQKILDLPRETPRITTDCKDCVSSSPPAQNFGPSSVDIMNALLLNTCMNIGSADDGYESFSEAVNRVSPGLANFTGCPLEPCENGYQALPAIGEFGAD
ncbi:hypothetical protein GJAV_G00217520 [Gymnothorax javanicus]|nr:hypothetical protein GJAV_G00217520 [Gymnothorax javanicus]